MGGGGGWGGGGGGGWGGGGGVVGGDKHQGKAPVVWGLFGCKALNRLFVSSSLPIKRESQSSRPQRWNLTKKGVFGFSVTETFARSVDKQHRAVKIKRSKCPDINIDTF